MYRIKGRKRNRDSGVRNLQKNTPYPKAPPWIERVRKGEIHLDPQDALPMYNIYVMMRLRNITRPEIADHLGLTRQRVYAMLLEGGESHARLEAAITAITDERHTKAHGDKPCGTSCAVYTTAGMDELQARKMEEAMKAEKREYPEIWSFEDEQGTSH